MQAAAAQNKVANQQCNMSVLFAVFLALISACLADEQSFPVNQQCLGCICEAISSCDTSNTCAGDVCGPFRITWAYWADAGKPTLNNEAQDSPTAYANCAKDTYCSALAVQGYMQHFQQDCNGDGKIDCDDFATIHRLGGYGCKGGVISGVYAQRYQQCKAIVGVNQP